MNILVLDDDQTLHAYYRHILKRLKGVGVITMSYDSMSFGRCLAMGDYHVIICDIHMAPIMGPEILRDHKSKLEGKEIIMLSCSDYLAEESNSLTSDGLNIRAYLPKPLVPQDLFDILECN